MAAVAAAAAADINQSTGECYVTSVLVFLSWVSYLPHSRLFLDFLFFTFLVLFKTFFVFF